ncbi:ATP-binding protein [Pectinatus sottacetonis]|uniref:ATP-binding protein n=1 Tax=Pectinatus sottacetonis TaxID=1002795 RepID=UPI0018C4C10F|nr:ATP-binding protein [Pectinatus sottacetonis]
MKQLLILSGKGGTGKTTVAGALIELSKAKALADCDVDAPNLHLITKMQGQFATTPFYGMDKASIDQKRCIKCGACVDNCRFTAISDDYVVDPYACEGCGVCQLVCKYAAVTLKPFIAGKLMLYKKNKLFSTAELKMGSGNSGLLVDSVKKQLIKNSTDEKFAIIDGSPGIGCPVIASLNGADMVLIVAEASVSGVNDMKRIIKTARRFQIEIAVCINKYDVNDVETKKIEKFCTKENLLLAGKIPFDKKIVEAVNKGVSIVNIGDSKAGAAIYDLFNNIKTFFAV